LCALEVVKINILGGVCAEPKEVCVLRGTRSLLCVELSGVQALKNPNPLKDVEALTMLGVAVLV